MTCAAYSPPTTFASRSTFQNTANASSIRISTRAARVVLVLPMSRRSSRSPYSAQSSASVIDAETMIPLRGAARNDRTTATDAQSSQEPRNPRGTQVASLPESTIGRTSRWCTQMSSSMRTICLSSWSPDGVHGRICTGSPIALLQPAANTSAATATRTATRLISGSACRRRSRSAVRRRSRARR